MRNVRVFPYHKALVRLLRKDPEGKTSLRRRLRERMAEMQRYLYDNGLGLNEGYVYRQSDRRYYESTK